MVRAMTKTLVTGAAGFIGSHVTRLLLDAGRDVRALIFPGEEVSNLDGLEIERLEGDIRDRAAMDRAMEGCDRVFHLAAIYAIWLPEPTQMWDVNVHGSRVVCDAALAAGIERMVYTSSIAAVGTLPGEQEADETVPFNGWGIANDYVFSKYVGELEARDAVRRGLPATIVNPAFPFGWGDLRPTPTGGIVLAIMKGQFPGWYEAGFNIVDVEDVAIGHLLAEEKGGVGERYILGNENLHSREFMQMVGEVCGRKVPDRKLPLPILKALGTLLETVSDRVTHKRPFMTRKAIEYAAQHLYYDTSKARTELGYEPRPVRDSIVRAAEWFRHRGLAH